MDRWYASDNNLRGTPCGSVMNVEKLASFHVLVLTFTYLRPFGNMLNQHMSHDLSNFQGCSIAALQPRLFGLYTRRMHVSALSPS